VAYYLPGSRSGGPVRTIANFVDQFSDEFEVRIITRDRDVGDTRAYPTVKVDAWNPVGEAQVFYASGKKLRFFAISQLLSKTPHDVLYLNSFFDYKLSILPLLARRLGSVPRKPCIMAPRGEFSLCALALKASKKRAYLRTVKLLGLHENLRWQASSELEVADIRRQLLVHENHIKIATDLPRLPRYRSDFIFPRKRGPLRLIFLSRISPIKNLEFLLRLLIKANFQLVLTVCGHQENQSYWRTCQEQIKKLPVSVNVLVKNHIDHHQVVTEFFAHDLFVFPTLGENFGHVIFEALSAGTSVLVSDRTPWQAHVDGAVTVLPLDEYQWLQQIRRWSEKSEFELLDTRKRAVAYAKAYLENSPAITQNRLLFSRDALNGENT
jgi:glycosyltransferase involved in cell wall biosynthesis